MKKAFTLMEVMIAVVLLVGVFAVFLQMQENNMLFIKNEPVKNKLHSTIVLPVLQELTQKNKTSSYYVKDLINIKDDEIRQEFKEIKIVKKKETLEQKHFSIQNVVLDIEQSKLVFNINNSITKNFYIFKFYPQRATE